MKFVSASILFLSGISSLLMGQNIPRQYFIDQLKIQSSESRIEKNKDGNTILISEFRGENVKLQSRMDMTRTYLGTPYFGDQWYMGSMYFKGGKEVNGVMAYNLVNNTLYYSLNENVQAIEVNPDKFTLGEVTFQSFDNQFIGTANFYYEAISDGEPKLLKQYIDTFVQLNSNDGSSYGSNPQGDYEGEFVKSSKYYIVIQKKLVLVTKKRSFIKSLGPYQKKAKVFVDHNHLNLKKEEDIINLIQHLDQSAS
jgi:hypothetical protein